MLAKEPPKGEGQSEACYPVVERWQPGGQLSYEQMSSAADIAFSRTKHLPSNKASGVHAPQCHSPPRWKQDLHAGATWGGGPLLKASLSCQVAQNQNQEKVRLNRDCAFSERPTRAVCESRASRWVGQAERFSIPSKTQLSESPPPVKGLAVPRVPLRALGEGVSLGKGGRASEERVRAGAAQSPYSKISVRKDRTRVPGLGYFQDGGPAVPLEQPQF